VSPDVLKARNQHRQYLDTLKAIEKNSRPKIENIENHAPQPAARQPNAKLVEERP